MKDMHEDLELAIDGKDIVIMFDVFCAKWEFRSGRIARASVECNILVKDFWRGNCKLHGKAFCSEKDTYNKVTGYKIALTRALAQVPLTKEFRTKVWQAFWELAGQAKQKEACICKTCSCDSNGTATFGRLKIGDFFTTKGNGMLLRKDSCGTAIVVGHNKKAFIFPEAEVVQL